MEVATEPEEVWIMGMMEGMTIMATEEAMVVTIVGMAVDTTVAMIKAMEPMTTVDMEDIMMTAAITDF